MEQNVGTKQKVLCQEIGFAPYSLVHIVEHGENV